MLGDATEAIIASAVLPRAYKIAQHVERGKVIRINSNDLTVFLWQPRSFPIRDTSGCAQSLCFVKNHLNPRDWKTFENCREAGWLEGAVKSRRLERFAA